MKQILFLSITSLMVFGCHNMKKTKQSDIAKDTVQSLVVGGDADEHGCRASAGYTWSVIKNDCIRVWETGIQLEPLDNQPFNATVVVSDDLKKAELFIINTQGSIILEKTNSEKDVYSGSQEYEFSKQEKGWLLKKGGKSIYKN